MKELPYEIWFTILEMAVRPELHLDLIFEPLNIELAYLCLTNRHYGSQYAAQVQLSRNKTKLIGVCQWWNAILDSIQAPKKWIVHDIGHFEQHYPLDTRKTARLNQVYQSTGQTMPNRIRYSHPISTLSLSFLSTMGKHTTVPPLSDIISFQEELRVLDLQWPATCKASRELLTDIQVMATSLTTLSLTLPCKDTPILQFPLVIPTLVSLFVSVPRCDGSWNKQLPEYNRWSMPSLRHLSLTGVSCGTHRDEGKSHPFFLQLLETHFDVILALRVHPMIKEVADPESPLYWACMPKLKSLATDFTWKNPSVEIKIEVKETPVKKSLSKVGKGYVAAAARGLRKARGSTSRPSKDTTPPPEQPPILPVLPMSESVRHLIHIAAGFNDIQGIVDPFSRYICACSCLESVSLVDPYNRYREALENKPTRELRVKVLKQLQELCNEQGAKLWDHDGKEF
jgi:hypothetical protein